MNSRRLTAETIRGSNGSGKRWNSVNDRSAGVVELADDVQLQLTVNLAEEPLPFEPRSNDEAVKPPRRPATR